MRDTASARMRAISVRDLVGSSIRDAETTTRKLVRCFTYIDRCIL